MGLMKMKRKISISKILTFIIIILFIILFFAIKDIIVKMKNVGQNEVQVVDNIEEYGYSMNENDSSYFKELFEKLKLLLKKDSYDEEEYASLISQLFITDFYSLDKALNKNDIGGTQFVYTDYQSDFIELAKESVYATVENNIYGNRNQELPLVKEVTIDDVSKTSFEMKGFEDEKAYEVKLSISYVKDLDYPKEATIVLVHANNKLEIAQLS